MAEYKMIVSDLDGTLLDSDMQLGEKNAKAISEFHKMGINFVASSGRTFYEIPSEIRENTAVRYLIYSNGTVIFDKEKGVDIVSNRISRQTANEIFDILRDYDYISSLHVSGRANMDKGALVADLSYYQINDYYKTLLMRSTMVSGIEKLARESDGLEAVVLFFHDDSELEACKKRLLALEEITVTSSIGHNIELCSSRAGKGAALRQLASILGIPKEEIIAVGDNTNDVSMFSEVGLSLCTANGNEEAKALSHRVICSNNDGVADYILHRIIEDRAN